MPKRFLLALCLVAGVAGAADPVVDGAVFSRPVMGISDAGDLKGAKRVAIASFVVQYVVKQTEEMVIDLEKPHCPSQARASAPSPGQGGPFTRNDHQSCAESTA